MRLKKCFAAGLFTGILCLGSIFTAFAGQWQQNDKGWWYDYGNGTFPANTWEWIDGNGDGVAECYYFNNEGYVMVNAITPDGSSTDGNGAWMVNGVVQATAVQSDSSSASARSEASITGVEVVNNPEKTPFSSRVIVTLSDGTKLNQDYLVNWRNNKIGWEASAVYGDVTGDGKAELIVNLEWSGSTYQATDVYIYQVKNGQLVEHSSFLSETVSDRYPKLLSCSGAKIRGRNLQVSGLVSANFPKKYGDILLTWDGMDWIEKN